MVLSMFEGLDFATNRVMASQLNPEHSAESADSCREQRTDDNTHHQTNQPERNGNSVSSQAVEGGDMDSSPARHGDSGQEEQETTEAHVPRSGRNTQDYLQEASGGAQEDFAARLQARLVQSTCEKLPDHGHASLQQQTPSGPLDQSQLAGVTTHVAPVMAPDLDIDDEGFAESTSTSYVTSIASEISRGILENDRIYPQYGGHSYGMPVDEEEMERMELQHRKYEMLLGNRHFLAPIGESPQKILDLGTGTGIWALDVADMFPSASVTGVDIAPIQPRWVAPNCQFEIDDVEAEWTWKRNSFDFIHLRDPLMMIRDWPKLMRQTYDHLRPGGWCELASIHPQPTSDDGSMPRDSGFKLICDKLIEASALFGTPLDPPSYHQYLHDAGFIDVTETIFKIPSSPWPKDKRLKTIGALEMTNVIAGATAFGLRAFERVFGWSKLQTEVAMIDFKRDVRNRSHHQYCPYFVVYGRRPPDPSDSNF